MRKRKQRRFNRPAPEKRKGAWEIVGGPLFQPVIIVLLGLFFTALLLCGFAAADYNTRQSGFRDNPPIFQVSREGPLSFRVIMMGEERDFSVEWLNKAAGYGQKFYCFVPAKLRAGIKLTALGAAQADEWGWL